MTRTHRRTGGLALLAVAALVAALIVHVSGSSEPEDGVAAAALGAGTSGERGTPVSAVVRIGLAGPTGDYATPRVTISQDGQLSVENNDRYSHTVTSEATDAEGRPLFDVTVAPGATRVVRGATGLAAGDYGFYCRLHPNMRGTLTVTGGSGGNSGGKQRFTMPLAVPRTVTDAHVRLDMRRTQSRMLPDGRRTTAWTYGGSWPGPTIRRPAGRQTLVTVANHLPRKAGSMSMHLHGSHHASRYDGQPTTFLVRRGHSRTYRYDLVDDGKPAPGSFFWYHDHRMDRTTRNNWMGLQGMFIVEDPQEAAIGLPQGVRDVPLMIADRTFTKRNQLGMLHEPSMVHGGHDMDHDAGHDMEGMDHGDMGDMGDMGGMAWTGPHAPPNDASVGNRLLVNGRVAPHLRTTATRYRLRLLNSSAFSSYNLVLSNGRPFTQIGTGDGLLPHPVVRKHILLGPAQRADVIVDFHGLAGTNVVLKTVPRAKGIEGTGSRVGDLMQFRVRRAAADDSRVPKDLPTPELVDAPRKISMTWDFSLEGDPETGSFWAINGKAYDADRVDHRVKLGTVETWKLKNTSDITHYVHLHQLQWRTVSRNGKRPPPWERGLEDTWKLDPGEVVLVAAKFTDYTGPFMVHCHMLDHEDHGMMATFEVHR
ncbi:multicopper oxidase domain-containing protein [Nocardioides sp. SR21]|uniref:multicopper oxidase domain-containing protein n=1 Tax=Nocardioides sp. SR21 TaxID=2919501 RepID=UPI001FAB0637|nr:multicopper oxidase domain-containing protein [Nocardioides sp. SR21]